MHTQVNTAETCTKIFSMNWRLYLHIFCLSNIAAYCSMKFSFPKTLKICDFKPCANKRTFRMETLEYEDDENVFKFLVL